MKSRSQKLLEKYVEKIHEKIILILNLSSLEPFPVT